ncbi:AMP nucleosidase [Microvirga pudoricolor]|uniref:AMP nucleosidase n=1 Tax=Microvirga pudoricolor TaxID=2778729 RepID=UPI00194EDBE4|nr:AMP nucleosidase [Microvirga pudoricolor]MBM6595881.1 AMP nucleosidase [Microvirga pudoricolor]
MPDDRISHFHTVATPQEAVERLIRLHETAIEAQRHALEHFFATGEAPSPSERPRFRYPELRVIYRATAMPPVKQRAYAKLQGPGVFTTTVTQPAAFKNYLLEQLNHLVADYGVQIEVGLSDQEIPYPYVFERGDELGRGAHSAAELAQHFPTPLLAKVGDEIADGTWVFNENAPRPLALFDAARVDYSLRRLVHYTGTDWQTIQPWILLTNYHRYVDQFVRWAIGELSQADSPYERLVLPGGIAIERGLDAETAAELVTSSPWHRFQMPAYHLVRKDGQGGVTLVNIGVGPSNAKNITDHLAVLRPHCWLMVGHCGGLRQSQTIGDYVLAHGYLRRDKILDDAVPPEIPVPALAEVQVALQEAAAGVTGERGEELKRRLRTGTVVTYDDRNWELRWSQERRQINLSRAIAVDMESGTIAAQGYRLRVPYGTLLCVSDKPLHGEIKLPGAANAFYERAVSEHLMIGLAAIDILRGQRSSLHSRKLRSFDEPPFR